MKGYLLHYKVLPFAKRKVTLHKLKGYLSKTIRYLTYVLFLVCKNTRITIHSSSHNAVFLTKRKSEKSFFTPSNFVLHIFNRANVKIFRKMVGNQKKISNFVLVKPAAHGHGFH